MTTVEALFYVIGISIAIALISGWLVQRWGYSFWQYFVSGFIASCGILGLVFKLILDYL